MYRWLLLILTLGVLSVPGRSAALDERAPDWNVMLKHFQLLADNYNGATVAHIMCRTQLNVDYDGGLYDCEVNHVLGLPLDGPANVRDIVDAPLPRRRIKTSPICYSCAAGCGSSCGGSLLEKYAK